MNREAIVLGYVGSDGGKPATCCFCGEPATPVDGFVFFFEGSSDVVCLRCAKEIDIQHKEINSKPTIAIKHKGAATTA